MIALNNWGLVFALKVVVLYVGIVIWIKLISLIKNEKIKEQLSF